MNEHIFASIEFLEEKSVETIPLLWTFKEDGELFAYWPRKDPIGRAKRCELPDPLWSAYKIRLFGTADTYEKAAKLTEKAMDTSTVETEKEEECFADRSDAENEDNQNPKSAKRIKKPKAPKYDNKKYKVSGKELGAKSQSSVERKCDSHMPHSMPSQTNFSSLIQQEPRSSSTPITAAATSRLGISSLSKASKESVGAEKRGVERPITSYDVATKIDILIEKQDIMMAMMRGLVAANNNGDDVCEDVLPRKIKSVEELEELEQKLLDANFRKKLINYFSSLGGRNCKDTVRRIMRTAATNKVWSAYSYTGRKGKRPFNICTLSRVIIKAAKKINKSHNEQAIEDEMRDVMRHAPNRPGGSKYKPKDKGNQLGTDTALGQQTSNMALQRGQGHSSRSENHERHQQTPQHTDDSSSEEREQTPQRAEESSSEKRQQIPQFTNESSSEESE